MEAGCCMGFWIRGIFVLITPSVLKRILSIFILREDSSTSFRMNVYHSSFQMFCDNWILGIGTGNKTFREIYGLYMLSGYDALSCYSVFLEILVESGIFALIAYLFFSVYFNFKCRQGIHIS
jgi:putative inorganic carbon (HCO3(-)) transporter